MILGPILQMRKLKAAGIRWTSGPMHDGNWARIQSLSNFGASRFTGTGSRVTDHTGLPGMEGFLLLFPQLKGKLDRMRWVMSAGLT